MIAVICLVIYVINFAIGLLITANFIDSSKINDPKTNRILAIGIPYWFVKLIIYIIKYKSNKKRKAENLFKEKNDDLINSIIRKCHIGISIHDINDKINELKESASTDLYARVVNANKDMMDILIKCSDGEGEIDNINFGEIIKESIIECNEVVCVAWNENKNRLNEEMKINYKNRKDDLNKDLENMKNKNKDFKNMWVK